MQKYEKKMTIVLTNTEIDRLLWHGDAPRHELTAL